MKILFEIFFSKTLLNAQKHQKQYFLLFCTRFEVLAWLLEQKVKGETYPFFKNKEGSFN